MTYGITRTVFEEHRVLEITSARYSQISEAMRSILESLAIEEKFNLVLENFEEFEAELLRGALDRSLFAVDDWSQQMSELHRIGRRLANLLATCRLYVDQVPHNLSNLFGPEAEATQNFATWKSREYDARLGYRVLEAMRNYMQHRGLPVHAISHRAERREVANGSLLEHTLTPQIEPAQYREDGKFKAAVLTELERLGPQLALTPFVRQYIAGLGAVHKDLRALLSPEIARWDGIVEQVGAEFNAAGAEDLTGLAVVRQEEDGVYHDIVHISPGPIVRRRWLQHKNRHVEHYERVLVVNRPTD
jgi:hypothetical protein